MKFKSALGLLFVMILFFVSCTGLGNQAKKEKFVTNKEVAENVKNIEVDIEGMTCEIGCARLIQSKLYKTEGVKFAKVSFKDKQGEISYDANRISEEEIKEKIQSIAGGDLYKVTASKEVESFTSTN